MTSGEIRHEAERRLLAAMGDPLAWSLPMPPCSICRGEAVLLDDLFVCGSCCSVWHWDFQ